jgi:hypothetical protein
MSGPRVCVCVCVCEGEREREKTVGVVWCFPHIMPRSDNEGPYMSQRRVFVCVHPTPGKVISTSVR